MRQTTKFFFALAALFFTGCLKAQTTHIGTWKKIPDRNKILVTRHPAARVAKKRQENSGRVTTHARLLSANNACGVSASFTPEGDSTFPTNREVIFTSTSTNAASLQWLMDGIYAGTDNTLDMWFTSVGLHEVKLVARNGNCSDTAVAYYLLTGTTPPRGRPALLSQYGFHQTDEFSTAMCTLKDGSYLLGGYSVVYNSQEGDRGILIKVKPSGCVEWTRLFQGEPCRVSSLIALKDSGFLVAVTGVNGALYRMDSRGNVKWKFSYKTENEALAFRALYELSDGSIVAGAEPNFFDGFYLLKLTSAGGLVWNKLYMKDVLDFASPKGLAELGDNIYVSGYVSNPNHEALYNSEHNKDGFIVSVNKATGITNWSKTYGAIGYADFFQDIHVYGNNLLVNDLRTNYLGGANEKQTFHFIAPDGKILKSSKVVNTPVLESPLNSQIIPLSDGKLYLSQCGYQTISLQPGFNMHSNWQKIDTANHIYWQRIFSNYPRGYFQAIDTGRNESLVGFGTEANLLQRPIYNSKNFLLVQMDSSGLNNDFACTFYNSTTTIVPDTIVSVPLFWAKDTVLAYEVNVAPRMPNVAYSEVRYACPDFVDSCNYIRVNGQRKLCDLSATYVYRVAKSHGCFQPVEWDLPAGVEVVSKTDSVLQVRFAGFGTYKIGALLANECTPMKDSIYVTARSSSAVLDLGKDTAICTGNNLTLKAGKEFLTYLWQNNSTDSNLVVNSPGKYWVMVTDSCGNKMSDTVTVSAAPPIPFNVGPDRTKCNNDTLHLDAPPGFLNYVWSSNYNLSSSNSQNVVVSPLVDTAYFVKAEKTPGCFAYDTVRISVHHSPPIDLGADKRFCLGGSVVFDAGTGFQTYLWSSGQTSREITTSVVGSYSVVATTTEGCRSTDTVKVVQVYPLPVVSLDKKSALCFGESRSLSAGNYSSYQWNTGATSAAILVKDTGVYAVTVTDANGCKNSDTTSITTINPLPNGFLPPDTAICSYGSLVLTPLAPYNRYVWSTGTLAKAITITKPGTYWLEVRDNNGCTGRDSIVVNPRNCMSGFYIPTAFSPNGDGKNDVYRPLLFGNVKHYQFRIYNRWGQVVFQSTDPQKGWNGKVGGLLQESGVFVWQCNYQMEGEAAKTEKGTVTLIR